MLCCWFQFWPPFLCSQLIWQVCQLVTVLNLSSVDREKNYSLICLHHLPSLSQLVRVLNNDYRFLRSSSLDRQIEHYPHPQKKHICLLFIHTQEVFIWYVPIHISMSSLINNQNLWQSLHWYLKPCPLIGLHYARLFHGLTLVLNSFNTAMCFLTRYAQAALQVSCLTWLLAVIREIIKYFVIIDPFAQSLAMPAVMRGEPLIISNCISGIKVENRRRRSWMHLQDFLGLCQRKIGSGDDFLKSQLSCALVWLYVWVWGWWEEYCLSV